MLNRKEVNFRAMRDLGLAAWFGGSLANALTLNAAGDTIEDPQKRIETIDTAMRKATPVTGAAMAAYLVGTQLVRENGEIFAEDGTPKIFRSGPESPFRAALSGLAVGAAVTQRILRNRIKANEAKLALGREVSAGAEGLKGALHALQWLVPGLTAWLVFLHAKEDVLEHHVADEEADEAGEIELREQATTPSTEQVPATAGRARPDGR